MKYLHLFILFVSASNFAQADNCPTWLDSKITKLHSVDQIDLCKATSNRTTLIVNTASHCGFTPQFKSLETLYQKYREQGLTIIGFPSNDFNQEADNAEETAKVCYKNYGVSFLMTTKVNVKGHKAHPVFSHLAEKAGAPRWNFNKYLVDREGKVVARFNSGESPLSDNLTSMIESHL